MESYQTITHNMLIYCFAFQDQTKQKTITYQSFFELFDIFTWCIFIWKKGFCLLFTWLAHNVLFVFVIQTSRHADRWAWHWHVQEILVTRPGQHSILDCNAHDKGHEMSHHNVSINAVWEASTKSENNILNMGRIK